MSFTIGTDIEVFAKTKKGEAKSLCGLIGGTKDEPKQLEHLPPGFMVQEDNVSLEFNIPPAHSKTEFIRSIRIMRKEVANILATMDLKPSTKSSIIFSKEELKHPNALVFGCEPDFNAWKKIENKKPYAKEPNLRTAGGHVHVGINGVDMLAGIRAMDLFLGIPSLLLDNSPEAQQRRELYGKAGAMRPKPYGFEYRVLSNFWLFKDTLVDWVYNNTRTAMTFCEMGNGISKTMGKIIQEAINTGDQKTAQDIVNHYKISLPRKKLSTVPEPKPKGPSFTEETLEQLIHEWNPQPAHLTTNTGIPQHFTPATLGTAAPGLFIWQDHL